MKMEKKYQKVLEKVSFITTIFNEEKSITGFLKSLLEQNFIPEEIIIVDGGSSDNTIACVINFFSEKSDNRFLKAGNNKQYNASAYVKNEEVIEDFSLALKDPAGFGKEAGTGGKTKVRIRLFSSPGSNISEGRNIAISHASNEIICGSDGGCSLDKNWSFEITRYYFDDKNQFSAAGGFSHPVALTFLEKLLEMCIMPGKKEIDPKKFMPSSRNISFLKSAWQAVGGYPRYLDYGEDMKFNFNLVQKGFKIAYNPDAVVYWRMRESLVMVFKQFFRYAKGDAIGKMYTHRHLIRFLSLVVFIALIVASIFASPWLLVLFAPLILFYIYKPLLRVNDTWSHIRNPFKRACLKMLSIVLAPFMLLFIDTAKALGYVYGKTRKNA
jgi:glycosyltransferase involved in cell wall biosynthesis